MTVPVGPDAIPTVDARVVAIHRVVDGDSIWLIREDEGMLLGKLIIARDPEPVNVRMIIYDTPERGDREGWLRGRADLQEFVDMWNGELRIRSYGEDSFGRLLGELYVEWDPGISSTKWMMINKGWPLYERK